MRSTKCEATFLRVLPSSAKPDKVRRAKRDLARLAIGQLRQQCQVEILLGDEALELIAKRAEDFDLLILGVQRHGRRKKLFGGFTRQIAQRTSCPLIVMSRRG